jgi:hypothetical protein
VDGKFAAIEIMIILGYMGHKINFLYKENTISKSHKTTFGPTTQLSPASGCFPN